MSWETSEQLQGETPQESKPPVTTSPAHPAPAPERPLSYGDLRRFLLLVFGLVLTALLAGALSKILLLFAIAFFIAAVLNTPVSWLCRRGMKRPVAVILVLFCGLIAVGGVAAMVVPTILEQTNLLAEKAPTYGARIQEQLGGLTQRYPALDGIVPETDKLVEELKHNAQPMAMGLLSSTFAAAKGLFGAVFLGFLTLLLTVFVLINPQPVIAGLLGAVPDRHREAAERSLERFLQQMGAWAKATLVMGLITGVSTGLLLHFVGVQPALLFGTLACFGELVPNIGPVVAAVPALFVAAGEGPTTLLWAIAAILFVQQVESNVLVPYIMGTQMELHPVSIVFFALAMGTLFGAAGAMLAVPAAATIKILYDEFYTRPQRVPVEEIARQAQDLIAGLPASVPAPQTSDV